MLKERIENNKERLSLVAEQISVDRERDFQKFEVKMNNKIDNALDSRLEALERKIATERQKDFKEFEAKIEARLDIMQERMDTMQESILSALNAK
jgi:uncharacterized coiled-coil protein SlyX